MRTIASWMGRPSGLPGTGRRSYAVNQRLPSGPATRRLGMGTPGERGNSVTRSPVVVGDRDDEGIVGGFAKASQALVMRQSAVRSPTRAKCRRLNGRMGSLAADGWGHVHHDTRDE